MTAARALIVDDEPDILELLDMTLTRMGLEVSRAADVRSAFDALERHSFQLCLTDMKLPDGNGIDIVTRIAGEYPATPVAMITAYGNTEAAVTALKAGAFDFVSKPVDLRVLRELVTAALKLGSAPAAKPEAAVAGKQRKELLGKSSQMERVRATIAKLARSQAPVYVSGESGVGKELAAVMIHEQGPRADGPFIPVNCGAIPTELMESEFFGHKKGSFTGAVSDSKGLILAANGGTLFLDEVADLPLSMQVKLLRVIQEKTIRQVGGSAEVPVDFRILSATHKSLADLVDAQEFRQDLYYRINVIELRMPSLRHRPADIAELCTHLLKKISNGWDLPHLGLSRDALKTLESYPFPGNVRELENILSRAATLCESEIISTADLNLEIRDHPAQGTKRDLSHADSSAMPLNQYIGEIERAEIEKALVATRYNKTAAAKKLGMTFRAFRYKLKKLGID